MISALTGALASARSNMREKRSVSGDRSTTTATTNMKKSYMTDAAGTDERDNNNHYDNGQFSVDCIQFLYMAPSLVTFPRLYSARYQPIAAAPPTEKV